MDCSLQWQKPLSILHVQQLERQPWLISTHSKQNKLAYSWHNEWAGTRWVNTCLWLSSLVKELHNALIMDKFCKETAVWITLLPSWSGMETSAPDWIKIVRRFMWPLSTAMCSGVCPIESKAWKNRRILFLWIMLLHDTRQLILALTSMPGIPRRASTISLSPDLQARCSAICLFWSGRLMMPGDLSLMKLTKDVVICR